MKSIIGRRNFGIVWVLMAVLWMTGSTASGRTIYVDGDANGANDGSSWTDAFKYLQDALSAAQSGMPKKLSCPLCFKIISKIFLQYTTCRTM